MLAPKDIAPPSANDDNRRLRMMLNNRNMGVSQDSLSNSAGVVSNVGLPLQAGGPSYPCSDTNMLAKVIVFMQICFSLWILHYLFNFPIHKFLKL